MSVRVVPSWLPKPKAIFCLLAVVALMSSGTQLRAQTSVAAGTEVQTVVAARQTLDQFFSIQIEAIPPSMLQSAAGVAIFPNMVKGGFILGVNYGKGVLHVRNQDQSWSPPVMVTMGGGSIGFQAGVQAADIVLVFKTPQSLTNILGGQKVTLGADASVAVGPVGRQANAATDARLGAEIYSYARSRGLFLGVSLEVLTCPLITMRMAFFTGDMVLVLPMCSIVMVLLCVRRCSNWLLISMRSPVFSQVFNRVSCLSTLPVLLQHPVSFQYHQIQFNHRPLKCRQ